MNHKFECIVAGSCVLDLLCRPVKLDEPVGPGKLHYTQPLLMAPGGIVSNSGVTMARLGIKTAAMTYVGDDAWAPVIRDLYAHEKIDTSMVTSLAGQPTSTSLVLIDPSGERAFLHCLGAHKMMDKNLLMSHIGTFKQTQYLLLGYYSMMPVLEPDLFEVFKEIRKQGCKTALDAAGSGGVMQPLDKILPQVDVYVPSFDEAVHQTKIEDPRKMIAMYRDCGAPGLVGVKLGKKGVMLSPRAGEYLEIGICTPPGPVVDTTGAGDSFFAGLVAGLIRGLPAEQAGRMGTAAAACCITALGGSGGGKDWATTARIAGV